MWGRNLVEAIGLEGERIHPMQNKGDRVVLNPPQGSGPAGEQRRAVYHEVVGGGGF